MSKNDSKKVLISWIAFHNDFDKGVFKPNGPNGEVFREFAEDYDQIDFLLSWEQDDQNEAVRTFEIKKYLQQEPCCNKINLRYIAIQDPVSVNEIRGKMEAFLLNYQGWDIEIFVSPGTPQMQIAWYFIHVFWKFPTRLFQTRKARHRQQRLQREYIELTQSSVTSSVVIKQAHSEGFGDSPDYVISTPVLQPIYENARKIAYAEKVTCLITGESGTGKEHLARYIHEQSSRKTGIFVAVNCSAFSDTLLESRLFGYKKAAFTGAEKDTKGLWEEAHHGTLFLDEIGDITPYMQQLLLRAMQEGEILPIGDIKPKKVNVRIIAATNRDLIQMCEEGKFRWDLYYRLAVAEIQLPSLRQRGRDELKVFLEYFLAKSKKDFGKKEVLKLSRPVKHAILDYPFPGNIRELENLVQRLYVFCTEEVYLHDLPERMTKKTSNFSWKMEDVEKVHLRQALLYFKWNKAKVCAAIGYNSINTLYSKIKKYNLEPEDKIKHVNK